MARFVSLLRGINVSGHNPIKMAELREALAQQGCEGVQSYIQSGNLIVDVPAKQAKQAKQAKHLSAQIHDVIEARFGWDVPVWICAAKVFVGVVDSNPFLGSKGVDPAKLHFAFFDRSPTKAALAKMQAKDFGAEQFESSAHGMYLHCPDGYGRSKLANAHLERMLGVSATTRGWKTMLKLQQMLQA